MPTLKQLTCTIEVGHSNTKLKEYERIYRDGGVECFVAVPNQEIPFSIHLTTQGWIAPGLAMFVFIDGEYQSNRNKKCAGMPGSKGDEVEFRVRQKEEKLPNGRFIGRDWVFTELKTADANLQPNISSRKQRELGTIEVVVLRCNYEGLTGAPQHATRSSHAREASIRSAVRAQASKRQAPTKVPTPGPSDAGIGGLFGIFDGACDVNLDGTAPYPTSPDGPRRRYAYDDSESDQAYGGRRRGRMADDMPVNPYRRGDRGPGCNNDQLGRTMDPYARLSPRSPHVQFRDDHGPAPAPAGYGARPYGAPAYNHVPYNQYPYGGAPAQQHQQAYPQAQQHGPVWVPIPAGQNPGPPPQGDYDIQQALMRAQEQLRQLRAFNESHAQYTQQIQPQGQPHYHSAGPPPTATGSQAPQQAGMPIDPEMQRGAIWRLGQKFWHNLGYDGRILAAAVPHIAVLRTNLIIDLNDIQRTEMKRMYDRFVAQGTFPDGSPVAPMNPPDRKASSGRVQTPSQHNQTPQANVRGQTLQQPAWGSCEPQKAQTGWRTTAAAANARPANSPAQQASAWDNQTQSTPGESHSTTHSSSHDHFADDGNKDDKFGNRGWGDNATNNQGGNTGWDDNANKVQGRNAGWDNKPGDANQADTSWDTPQEDIGAAGGWGQSAQDNKGANAGWGGGAADAQNIDDVSWGTMNAPAQDNHTAGWGDTANNAAGNAWGDSNNDGWDTPKTPNPPKSSGSVRSSGASTKASYDPRAYVKPYWAEWRGEHKTPGPSAGRSREAPREAYSYPAGPKPTLPAGKSTEASHGVQAGRGADYTHKTYRPIYLDEMDMPYAVFTFKYRSKNRLEDILRRSIGSECEKIETDVEKGELMGLSKEQLVERLMRTKLGSAGKPPSVQGQGNGWANGASDEPDCAGGGDSWNKQGSSGEKVDTWDSGGNAATGGWDNKTQKSSRSQAQNGRGTGNNGAANDAGGWDNQSKKSSRSQNHWDASNNGGTTGPGGWDNHSNKSKGSKASQGKGNWGTNNGSKQAENDGWAQAGAGQTGSSGGWGATGAGKTTGNGRWAETGGDHPGASGGWAQAGEGKTTGNCGWSNADSKQGGGGGWDDTNKASGQATAAWDSALPKPDPNFEMPKSLEKPRKNMW